MNSTNALYSTFAGASGDMPDSITALVAELGSATKAAKLLGVAPRTIERYRNFEQHGRTKSNRQASATQRAVLGDAVARARFANRLERDGAHVVTNAVLTLSELELYRHIDVEIDGKDLKPTLDRVRAGDWEGAGAAFESAILDAYPFHVAGVAIDDFEMFHMEPA